MVSAQHIGRRLMTVEECFTYISQENGGYSTAHRPSREGAGALVRGQRQGRGPTARASPGVSMGKAGRAAQDWLV